MKKKTRDDRYWDAQKKRQILSEYEQELKVEGKTNTPHNAQLFAMKRIGSGHKYIGMTEREIILYLADKLPPMYD